jgi:protein-disulfide isomerase
MPLFWPVCEGDVRRGQTAPRRLGKGWVRVLSFPLEAIHPLAFQASEAAECAAHSRHFWEMRSRLFSHQDDLTFDRLVGDAESLGLKAEEFAACLRNSTTADLVRSEISAGRLAGIQATPSFVVGRTQRDNKVLGLRMVVGLVPYSTFESTIAELVTPQRWSLGFLRWR